MSLSLSYTSEAIPSAYVQNSREYDFIKKVTYFVYLAKFHAGYILFKRHLEVYYVICALQRSEIYTIHDVRGVSAHGSVS